MMSQKSQDKVTLSAATESCVRAATRHFPHSTSLTISPKWHKYDPESPAQTFKCSICMEESVWMTTTIGVPDVCDHKFCLKCLQEWCKRKQQCPLDRLPLRLILVSNFVDGPIIQRVLPPPLMQNAADSSSEREEWWNNIRCQVCRLGHDDHLLLLCDACDRAFHTQCLPEPLDAIPDGEWFCAECSAERSGERSIERRGETEENARVANRQGVRTRRGGTTATETASLDPPHIYSSTPNNSSTMLQQISVTSPIQEVEHFREENVASSSVSTSAARRSRSRNTRRTLSRSNRRRRSNNNTSRRRMSRRGRGSSISRTAQRIGCVSTTAARSIRWAARQFRLSAASAANSKENVTARMSRCVTARNQQKKSRTRNRKRTKLKATAASSSSNQSAIAKSLLENDNRLHLFGGALSLCQPFDSSSSCSSSSSSSLSFSSSSCSQQQSNFSQCPPSSSSNGSSSLSSSSCSSSSVAFASNFNILQMLQIKQQNFSRFSIESIRRDQLGIKEETREDEMQEKAEHKNSVASKQRSDTSSFLPPTATVDSPAALSQSASSSNQLPFCSQNQPELLTLSSSSFNNINNNNDNTQTTTTAATANSSSCCSPAGQSSRNPLCHENLHNVYKKLVNVELSKIYKSQNIPKEFFKPLMKKIIQKVESKQSACSSTSANEARVKQFVEKYVNYSLRNSFFNLQSPTD